MVREPDIDERAGSLKFGAQVRGLGYREIDTSEPNRQRSGSRGHSTGTLRSESDPAPGSQEQNPEVPASTRDAV